MWYSSVYNQIDSDVWKYQYDGQTETGINMLMLIRLIFEHLRFHKVVQRRF